VTILDPLVAFSFDLLLGAGMAKLPLTVCPLGHLVVNGNSHYSPEAFAPGLKALSCRIVAVCDAPEEPT
jgi:hypothetical protein